MPQRHGGPRGGVQPLQVEKLTGRWVSGRGPQGWEQETKGCRRLWVGLFPWLPIGGAQNASQVADVGVFFKFASANGDVCHFAEVGKGGSI